MTQNQLAAETSPYLIQHKDNPVHWRPWNDGALAEARNANKPILLSIGYAACHWCHVMAHECFEDQEVADVMNRLFVNIKVDREERPDIDAIYMSALHHLGQQGGWPLTMFLTPDAEPFWGGTYFPKEPRYGRPGFVQVLSEVERIFREEPDKVQQNRDALLGRLRQQNSGGETGTLTAEMLDSGAVHLLGYMDSRHGGFAGAPKFPQVPMLEMLWRAGLRLGRDDLKQAVSFALNRMAMGGIYDHLAGGFSRYSVDEFWLVPHFEKMLYDNASLTDLMTSVWRETKSDLLRRRVEETIAWMASEMLLPEGGFASSLDADSEGEEGRFYVWTAGEVEEVLGPEESALFAAHYGVTPGGNWEGNTILNRLGQADLADAETEESLAAMRARLLERRAGRMRPGLDDKILADWNGLAIAGLAHAGFAFGRPDWLDLARGAYRFVRGSMMVEGARLNHAYRAGQAARRGMLPDYANMASAALALFEFAGEAECLEHAGSWMAVLDAHFWDDAHGGYFMSPDDAGDLIVRPRSAHDEATPNGNAIALANHVRLWSLTGAAHHRERADAIIAAFAADAQRNALGCCALLNAFDLALNATDLVLTGEAGARRALRAVLVDISHPNLVLMELEEGFALPEEHPATGKTAEPGMAAAYLCRQGACSLPVTAADELMRLVRDNRRTSD